MGSIVESSYAKNFDRVSDYQELINYLKDTEGHKLFIYDEAGVSIDSRRSSSSLNVALSHFVILARKFKAGIVVIVQDEGITDIRVRTMANVLVHKKNKKRAQVVERFGKETSYEIVNIGKSNIVYDTYDVAAFSLSPDEGGKYDPFRFHNKQGG